MKNIFKDAISELRNGNPVVISTVVQTKGSTPQKPGAKLLVKSDGSGIGTLGGGCVEGDIWFESTQLLHDKKTSKYRDYVLNEELAAEDGLICGGTMYFLIDPIYSSKEFLTIANEINDALNGNGSVALATLISNDNQNIGKKMLIREDGSIIGTLGNKALNQDAKNRSTSVMIHGTFEHILSPSGEQYFLEGFTNPPTIILCGGGHISKAISSLAANLGFKIIITDDRKEFANSERFPEAKNIYLGKPEDILKEIKINRNNFIIIATRGHRHDNVALKAAIDTNAHYIGLLGSKRKTILIYKELLQLGYDLSRIKEIHAPVGLNINATSPAEIAVSIMSEILMVRYGGTGQSMKIDESHIRKLTSSIK
ncbi:MAG: hypothetical protein CL760_04015 [Chloroflexi bacterium]|nr:hypothetical protein [Chloroflexota bacterium]MCH2309008.1 XdhC family protein [SAR202 cluster bacterium]MQG05976.1 XdhC family protein [SAR202 cluster bacterium]|tara:strand:- start:12256 stop:13362 length:1107 start_codon:yes stop_codon:yes gene_type:complete